MFLPLAWVLFRQSPGCLFSSSPTPWKENNIQPIDVDGNSSAQPGVEDLNGPTSLLLIDTDTRAGKRACFGNEESELADVIMLLHIPADRKNAVALSNQGEI